MKGGGYNLGSVSQSVTALQTSDQPVKQAIQREYDAIRDAFVKHLTTCAKRHGVQYTQVTNQTASHWQFLLTYANDQVPVEFQQALKQFTLGGVPQHVQIRSGYEFVLQIQCD